MEKPVGTNVGDILIYKLETKGWDFVLMQKS